MIEVAGFEVSRAGMIALAHRLVLSGENDTAARILHGLVNHDQITLEKGDRQAVIAALDEPLEGLALLRAVLLEENDERERVWLTQLTSRIRPRSQRVKGLHRCRPGRALKGKPR